MTYSAITVRRYGCLLSKLGRHLPLNQSRCRCVDITNSAAVVASAIVLCYFLLPAAGPGLQKSKCAAAYLITIVRACDKKEEK